MDRSGTTYRRLADAGLALLLVLAVSLSILAVRHVRSRPVAGGAQGAALLAAPAAAGGAPTVSTSTSAQPSTSPTDSTPASHRRVLLLVGPAQANSWAGNAGASGWPALVRRAGWTIVRVPSLGYTTDSGASTGIFSGVPTPPLPRSVHPVAVLVLTSAADGSVGPKKLRSDAAILWRRLQLAYPTAVVVALGPAPSVSTAGSAARTATGSTLGSAAPDAGVTYADPGPLAHYGHVTPAQFAGLVLLSLRSGTASPSTSTGD